ncbi:MAG TPA: c-type cytochrome domain-containing protein [Gemmataceae bacterium]|nr:c-type cytochrome domain-containing protein [Gemmataceae bacterium]
MKPDRRILLSVVVGLVMVPGASAQQPAPSYTQDIRPFLAKYCIECHTAKKAKAGVNLDTYQTMLRGNRKGWPVVVPGNPDKSSLVLTTEKKSRPIMPPTKIKLQPGQAEMALLRAWVAAGAKDDTGVKQGAAPALPATGKVAAQSFSSQAGERSRHLRRQLGSISARVAGRNHLQSAGGASEKSKPRCA